MSALPLAGGCVKDGPSCSGCGWANYEGLCPHCRGDQDAYECELVPPFPSSRERSFEEIGCRDEYDPSWEPFPW